MFDFGVKFSAGLAYEQFLAVHGSDEHRRRWAAVYEQVQLTDAQRSLLASFVREMPVVCLAGAWCGDCVNQCPIFQRFAEASSKLDIRYLDRDTHPDLTEELKICGGARVPVVVFLSEDGFEVGRYGDRTLSKYRRMVSQLEASACPSGLVVPEADLLAAVTQDWLNEFERAQWILRTSSRLRQKHGG